MSTIKRGTAWLVPPDPDYPDCDGEPIAESTLQFRWVTKIACGLMSVFRDDPNVFVAGDLFWYPVEGHAEIRTAPDAMVALGRPKGERGAYMQWREEGVAPQVVFEVLPPEPRIAEMAGKFRFYEQYGVKEYYIYDPVKIGLSGYLRDGEVLRPIPESNGWISPRLGIRFDMSGPELIIFGPSRRPLLSYDEFLEVAEKNRRRADELRRNSEEDRIRVNEARRLADEEWRLADELRIRADRLAAQLRALGIEPDEA